MIDVAIVNLPRLDLTRPAIAPGLLASLTNQIQLKNKIFDLALSLYKHSSKDDWKEYELYWQIDLDYKLEEALKNKLDKLFENYVQAITKHNPKFIAVSVFSHNSINATDIFLEKIRSRSDAKIIIGGQGIESRIHDSNTYAEYLLDKGLIDYFCTGEAETTFKNVLQGRTKGPGINNFGWKQLDNLDESPLPDYKGFELEDYHHLPTGKSFWINGSRGCVRRCDFCDIGKIWKKFRFRSGESLANEIKTQMENHNVKSFQFGDALINGSMKAFNDMTRSISKFIDQGLIQKPILGGHFIVRPIGQMLPENYELASKAGLDIISLGIESGSDQLRFRMNKKFTNDDIAYHLEQCKKNNIRNLLLMFSGHPTETIEDHKQTLDMLKRFRYFVGSETIIGLEVNSAAIIQDTPLSHWADENSIIFRDKILSGDRRFWYNPHNPDLRLKERIRRQLEIYETAISLGYPVNNMNRMLHYMKKILLLGIESKFKYL